MEFMELLRSLNGVGISPSLVALLAVYWQQDRRLTIVETILQSRKNG